MGAVEEIFAEFILMREKGLSYHETLNALRPYIEPLSKTSKRELAQLVRNREKLPAAPEPAPVSPPTTESPQSAKPEIESTKKTDWLTCPHCGKKNRVDAAFCYACGLMVGVSMHGMTKHFTDRLTLNNEYFGKDSVLIFEGAQH